MISNLLDLQVNDGDDIYIIRYDRSTKEVVSRKVPVAYLESSRSIPGSNVIGLDNDFDNGAPFWPEFYVSSNSRAQVVTFDMIDGLKEKGYLKDGPEVLNIGEDDNPVVVIYTFKE